MYIVNKYIKKMPSVTHHQGNADQTTMMDDLTLIRMATLIKIQKITSVGKYMEKLNLLEHLCTVGGTVEW